MSVALVSTCFREASHVEAFLDAILSQTRRPDEIVIVDAGSDDGTVELIQKRIASGAPIRLIVHSGANRSQGRNLAITATSAELIAVTDVGATPRPDWLERIVAPLEQNPEVEVVCGYYEPGATTLWEAAVAAATMPAAAEVDPERFLPSARSTAFRRTVWQRVGGYPEGACHNEDTPFALALRASGARFIFCPEALVTWRPHAAPRRLFSQFSRYALGDAQQRLWFSHYAKAYTAAALAVALVVAGAIWPPAWLGLPVLGLAYWIRHAARAARRTRRVLAWLLAPAANLVVDAAHVVGYTRGLVERRRHGA